MNKRNPVYIASVKCGRDVEDICSSAGISKDIVKKWDENPQDIIDFSLIRAIADETGVSLDDLLAPLEDYSPIFSEVYQEENQSVISLIEEKRAQVYSFRKKLQDRNDQILAEIVDEIIEEYDNVADIALRNTRKPVVCAFGRSDTGKSTLINYLLNDEVAHVGPNPVTSAIVYYHHVDEMPEYLRKRTGNAFVFGVKAGNKKNIPFSHEDIFTPTAKKYLIANDSFDAIMERFSTRKGSNYLNKEYKVFEIDVFLENKVLQEMTFIDIPGFDSDDKNDDVGLKLKNCDIDVVFYLSLAGGFMRPEEYCYLRNRMISRNGAEGVFVLATHAQGEGGPVKVAEILEGGCKRFFDSLSEQFREENQIQSIEVLREHYFAFDPRNAKYCKKLNDAFTSYMEKLVKRKSEEAKDELAGACKRLNTYYLERKAKVSVSEGIQKKNKKLEEEFINHRKMDLKFYRADLKRKIGEYRADCVRKFSQQYDMLVQQDQIVTLMDKRGTKNKNEDIQALADYVAQLIGDAKNKTIAENSKLFTNDINQVLDKYEESWTNDIAFDKLKMRFEHFDFQAAFAAGLTGIATMGALTVWAGVTAAGSNLGAYILVAKMASVLSISSTAAVQAVSALGGPAVFAVTFALIAALSVFGLFSNSWKRQTAKALVEKFSEENYKGIYVKQINEFWDGSIEQLDDCMDTLESKLIEYYYLENAINTRMLEEKDKQLQRDLNYLYGKISDVYWDIAFAIEHFNEQKISDSFHEQKKAIGVDLTLRFQQNHKYKLIINEDDFENLIFMEQEDLLIFWEDLEKLLDGELQTIDLSGGMGIYQRKDLFSIYYVLKNGEISIRYIDVFLHRSPKYEFFKDFLKNTYPIKNDQIRYKVFDMFRSAQKEILILMPWLNDYGWNKTGQYNSSVKREIVAALKRQPQLKIKIFVGYDMEHRDTETEEKTREKALEIQKELKKYGNRLEIITDIGTHEKKITVDDICALSGSFNLLSNDAPYQKKQWAADSMDVIENHSNIERQRREILERANRVYTPIADM